MDDDELGALFNYSAMSKTGSFGCLSKQTISNLFECILTCVTFASLVYIILLILGLLIPFKLNLIFHIIGYISLFSLITTPLGIYGSSKGSYCALFLFFVLASYHLYALLMYFWLNLRGPVTKIFDSTAQANRNDPTSLKDSEYLHFILSSFYLILVFISIVLVSCKITSLVNQIEPARVVVVDNNPVD